MLDDFVLAISIHAWRKQFPPYAGGAQMRGLSILGPTTAEPARRSKPFFSLRDNYFRLQLKQSIGASNDMKARLGTRAPP